MRPQSGIEPKRNTECDGDHHRQKRQFERGRHPLEDHLERRPRIDERVTQVAGKRAADKAEVLLVNRLVEPERLAGAFLLDLIGGRIDQDLDRIADQIQTPNTSSEVTASTSAVCANRRRM